MPLVLDKWLSVFFSDTSKFHTVSMIENVQVLRICSYYFSLNCLLIFSKRSETRKMIVSLLLFKPSHRRHGDPTPVLCGKSHESRSSEGCSPWGLLRNGHYWAATPHFPLSCIENEISNLLSVCFWESQDGESGGLPSLLYMLDTIIEADQCSSKPSHETI